MLDVKKKLSDMRLIVVAIGSYVSLYIARLILIMKLTPQGWALAPCELGHCYWLTETINLLISFSLTGFLFGICLLLLYEKSAKQLVLFIPLFGLLALYLWVNLSLQFLFVLLTSSWGLSYFVILPLSVFATILLMERCSRRQIAWAIPLAVLVLAVSRSIYALTPQYQEEQKQEAEVQREMQQMEAENQRMLRRLERSQRALDGY